MGTLLSPAREISDYAQFYGTLFKISMLDGWLVVFTGPKLIDELRRASDDELSAVEGTTQVRPPFRFSRREIHVPSIPRCRHLPLQTTTRIAFRSAHRLSPPLPSPSLPCVPRTHTHTHIRIHTRDDRSCNCGTRSARGSTTSSTSPSCATSSRATSRPSTRTCSTRSAPPSASTSPRPPRRTRMVCALRFCFCFCFCSVLSSCLDAQNLGLRRRGGRERTLS